MKEHFLFWGMELVQNCPELLEEFCNFKVLQRKMDQAQILNQTWLTQRFWLGFLFSTIAFWRLWKYCEFSFVFSALCGFAMSYFIESFFQLSEERNMKDSFFRMISMAKLFDMRIFKAHLLLFWITIILQEFQFFGFWTLVTINLLGLALSISLDPSVLPSLVRKGIASYLCHFPPPLKEQQYPPENKMFFPPIRIEEVKDDDAQVIPQIHSPGKPRPTMPKMRPLMKKIN